MKRDWDVIREVLLEVESMEEGKRNSFGYGVVSQGDPTKSEHAFLLLDAGYLSARTSFLSDGKRGLLGPNLTWEGHELLDTLRSKPVWEKIKATAKDKGVELTIDAVKALGKMALESVMGG